MLSVEKKKKTVGDGRRKEKGEEKDMAVGRGMWKDGGLVGWLGE